METQEIAAAARHFAAMARIVGPVRPQGREDAPPRLPPPPPPVGVHHALGVGPAPASGRPGRAAAAARPCLRGPRARGGRCAHGGIARRAVPGRGAAR
ncbi:hypothetical protein PVAP13_3KG371027 [Panicum virgatum]|uniref:Uncharacterized protein n=1 Tax=Panicum virgatum TaxID=38727 RepID=A0A8T0UUX0_PANVG|nr:hypothetical protein PVAP13_3KG371027 [Panicum virgatum]